MSLAMGLAAITGATAFAVDAPIAFWSATGASAVAIALALGRGPRRWAGCTAVISTANVIADPTQGWIVDIALAAALLSLAYVWPWLTRGLRVVRRATARSAAPQPDALLLGRTARVVAGGRSAALVRLRIDGRRVSGRVVGPALAPDALVRILRIDADGCLIVRAAAA